VLKKIFLFASSKLLVLFSALVLFPSSVLVLFPSLAHSIQFCYFPGPESSPDLIELSNFSVEGASSLKEGDFVTVKFQLRNWGQNDVTLGAKGIFAAVRDPAGSDASFGFARQDTVLKVGELVDFEFVKQLTSAGSWKIWPSYELKPAVGGASKFGPEEWHACTLSVGEVVKDFTPPELEVIRSPDVVNASSKLKITVKASDDSNVSFVRIFVNGEVVKECYSSAGNLFKRLEYWKGKEKYWECVFEGGPYATSVLRYYAEASDSFNNKASTREESIPVSPVIATVIPSGEVKCSNSIRGRIEGFHSNLRTVGIELCKAVKLEPGNASTKRFTLSSFIVGGNAGGIKNGIGNKLAGFGVSIPLNRLSKPALEAIVETLPLTETRWLCDPTTILYANLSSHASFEFNNLCPGLYKVSVFYQPFENECRWAGSFCDSSFTKCGPRIVNSSNSSESQHVEFFFRPLETTLPEASFAFIPETPSMRDGFQVLTNASDENGIQRIKMQASIEKTKRVRHHCRVERVQIERGGRVEEREVCDTTELPEFEFLASECRYSQQCAVIEAPNPNVASTTNDEGYTNYAVRVNASVCDGAENKKFFEQYFERLPSQTLMPRVETPGLFKASIDPATRPNAWNESVYRGFQFFLVPDTDWRAVLQVLPLAIWPNSGAAHGSTIERKHALIVFHQEPNGAFDLDSAFAFIKKRGAGQVTIFFPSTVRFDNEFDDVVWMQLGASGALGDPSRVTMQWFDVDPQATIRFVSFNPANASTLYDKFFEIKNRIMVARTDYENALQDAIIAAYYHLPIYFADNVSVNDLEGKNVTTLVTGSSLSFLRSHARQVNEGYSNAVDLQAGFETASEGKTILVNPLDVLATGAITRIPRPDFWPVFNGGEPVKPFARMSLAAPYLAVARRERLVFLREEPFFWDDGACDSPNHYELRDFALRAVSTVSSQVHGGTLTIIADPRFIPDSYYSSCASGAPKRLQVDRQFNPNGTVGRIYGITVTDASVYVARSVLIPYSSLFVYRGSDSFGTRYDMPAMLVTHSIREDVESARNIRDCCGFDWVCYAPPGEGCNTNTSPPAGDYLNKIFIIYLDHGSPNAWSNTISGFQLPFALNSPVVFGDACLTNSFWSGNEWVMGAWWIRKGASAYFGAVGVTTSYDCAGFGRSTSEAERFKNYWEQGETSLGQLNRDINSCVEQCSVGIDDCDARDHYLLLGDPLYRIPDTSSIETRYTPEEGDYECDYC